MRGVLGLDALSCVTGELGNALEVGLERSKQAREHSPPMTFTTESAIGSDVGGGSERTLYDITEDSVYCLRKLLRMARRYPSSPAQSREQRAPQDTASRYRERDPGEY